MNTEEDLFCALVVARNFIGQTAAYKCGDVGAGQTMRRINDAIERAKAVDAGRHRDPITDAAERAAIGL
jgi:hypothetical protein